MFVCFKTDPNDSNSPWTAWQQFPSPGFPVTQLGCVVLVDGRLQIFASVVSFNQVNPPSNLYTCWKTAKNYDAAWSPWLPFQNYALTADAMAYGNEGEEGTYLLVSSRNDLAETHKVNAADPNSGWSFIGPAPKPVG
jgi:hypothetical protein